MTDADLLERRRRALRAAPGASSRPRATPGRRTPRPRRTSSAAVKALRKPSVAAWVVNLLVRREAEQVEQVLAVGAALREAQEGMDGAELRALTKQRRQLTSAVTAPGPGAGRGRGREGHTVGRGRGRGDADRRDGGPRGRPGGAQRAARRGR